MAHQDDCALHEGGVCDCDGRRKDAPAAPVRPTLTQAWIDKVMTAARDDEPSVLGAGHVEDAGKRDAWTLRYIARMVEVGVPLFFALETYQGGADTHDYDADPRDAADGDLDAMTHGE